MRIGFVCSEYPPGPHGGIGTFTRVLSRELVRAGHEVRVVGVYPRSYPGEDQEMDQGVSVHRIWQPKHRLGWIHGRFKLFAKVSAWARDNEIDVIEVPDSGGWAAGWRRLPIPVIARLNGSVSYFARELDLPLRKSTFQIERSSMRRADYWCSVSQYTADKTRRLFGLATGPDAILYNSVEYPVGVTPSESAVQRKDVVFTGTLTYKKGVVSLVKAWPSVLAQHPDATLSMYGKDGRATEGGTMSEMLKSLLPTEQRGSIRFHSHVERCELFAAFQRSRVAVFPSYAEAFAIAPLEAMSNRCATIYSRRGSGTELIEDGVNGLLVDPDDPAAIAVAVNSVLDDDDFATRLAVAGQATIRDRFSVAAQLPQNVNFYSDCAARWKQDAASTASNRLTKTD